MVSAPPLAGVRVLDFGLFVAGPLCALMLAEMGAEVIRVERPGGGPDRFVQPVGEDAPGGAVHLQLNRGKRSIVLDTSDPAERPLLDELLRRSDVVIANMPDRALAAMGLAPERLETLNPRLILATVSAFGDGPWADRPGFDGVGQAMSGAMHLTGEGGVPRKAYAHYVDHLTAALSAFGVMAALRQRGATGRGQRVSASLLGSALLTMAGNLIEEAALGLDRAGTGNRAQLAGPADVFAATDGHVLLQVIGDAMFRRVARLVGHPEWITEPRFADDAARGANGAVLSAVLADWCAARSVAECLDAFAGAGLPAAPVLSPRAALAHRAVLGTGLLDAASRFPVQRLPIDLSGAPPLPLAPAAALDADGAAIRAELLGGA